MIHKRRYWDVRYFRLFIVILTAIFLFAPLENGMAENKAVPGGLISKSCMNCHKDYKEMKDITAGNFKSLSDKAKSIQLQINEGMELVKFTEETKVEYVPDIKSLKEPISIRAYFKKVGEDNVATKIVAKPEMKVPEGQLMSTEELARLVALGPEKGNYTLVDSRPDIKYEAGHIPTAISIPFPKMEQLKNLLPKDKNQLLVFYCEGMR